MRLDALSTANADVAALSTIDVSAEKTVGIRLLLRSSIVCGSDVFVVYVKLARACDLSSISSSSSLSSSVVIIIHLGLRARWRLTLFDYPVLFWFSCTEHSSLYTSSAPLYNITNPLSPSLCLTVLLFLYRPSYPKPTASSFDYYLFCTHV